MIKKNKRFKFILFTSIILILFIQLERSYFLLDKNGLYQYFYFPLIADQSIRFNMYSAASDKQDIDFGKSFYGPFFKHVSKDDLNAYWLCKNKRHTAVVTSKEFQIQCDGASYYFDLSTLPDSHSKELSGRSVYVFSDLHGNLSYLKEVLKKLNVVDELGRWKFGSNGLAILGDFLDKSSQDRELLWYLYHLEKSAHKSNGFVEVVLGNHEIFQMKGDFRYAHPVTRHLTQKVIPFKEALDSNTHLGRWLRKKKPTLTIGNNLLLHGGINVDSWSRYTPEVLNKNTIKYWEGTELGESDYQSIFGVSGVLNYRGLIKATSAYPRVNTQNLKEYLDEISVERVIFGHTEVQDIEYLHDNRALAIASNRYSGNILKLTENSITTENTEIINPENVWQREAIKQSFSIFSIKDWNALFWFAY